MAPKGAAKRHTSTSCKQVHPKSQSHPNRPHNGIQPRRASKCIPNHNGTQRLSAPGYKHVAQVSASQITISPKRPAQRHTSTSRKQVHCLWVCSRSRFGIVTARVIVRGHVMKTVHSLALRACIIKRIVRGRIMRTVHSLALRACNSKSNRPGQDHDNRALARAAGLYGLTRILRFRVDPPLCRFSTVTTVMANPCGGCAANVDSMVTLLDSLQDRNPLQSRVRDLAWPTVPSMHYNLSSIG